MPISLGLGTLLGAGISALIGGTASAINANQVNISNEKLQRQQNEWNLAQWNRENEYNSPQAQMQRFVDAGLNPNLIYGQGTNGNASHLTSAPAPEHKGVDYGSIITQILPAYLNLKYQQAQIDKIEKETEGIGIQNGINSQYGAAMADVNYQNAISKLNAANQSLKELKLTERIRLDKMYHEGAITRQQYEYEKEMIPIRIDTAKGALLNQYYDVQKKSAFAPTWERIAAANAKSAELGIVYQNLQNANASDRLKMNDLDFKIKSSNFAEWNSQKFGRWLDYAVGVAKSRAARTYWNHTNKWHGINANAILRYFGRKSF